jgi:1-deoxy-D-xylulose-5-phosphate reductoisomerase
MNHPKDITVLGSTGSIGRQTLEVIDAYPERFRLLALTCDRSADGIITQARKHRPQVVSVMQADAATTVQQALQGTGIKVLSGLEGAQECATLPEADIVMAAAVGIAGLQPVWAAIQAGKTVALANKEPLVVAGHLIMAEVKRTGATILPVDSEHSAVFQSLLGQDRNAVVKVTLTASGGAFRDLPLEDLAEVTPTQALAHPTWVMGPKVTIDSATLMNKGLELIEARWLFELQPEQLEVVLHRESIIHSLVQFADGSVLAHLAQPDMRIPIQYALSHPQRLPRPEPAPDLAALGALHFAPFDEKRWPCVALARAAMATGGTAPAAMNAADEVAVAWFLQGKIRFTAIPAIIEQALSWHQPQAGGTIEELLQVDQAVRQQLEKDASLWIR